MAVNIPANQVALMNQAASGTGLPVSVVAAQVNAESGFRADPISSAGAEGEFQFLPSTYVGLGFPAGTEGNPNEEVLAYIKYMKQLLAEEGGSVFKALEAYNAGPANLAAGAGYASGILSAAGQGTNITAGTTGSGVSTTSFNPLDPASWVPGVASSVASSLNPIKWIEDALGISNFKDIVMRLGLILFGGIIVIVGVIVLVRSGSAADSLQSVVANEKSSKGTAESTAVSESGATAGEVAAIALCQMDSSKGF
jgi:Transglycosylase SLT domain